MASLLDRIRQIGAAPAQPQQAGIQQILRQKTGKAKQVTGPKATGLGEQAAIQAGQAAEREQTFAERLQATQLRGQEQAIAESQQLQQQQLKQQRQLQQEQLGAQAALKREDLAAGQEEALLRREATIESKTRAINNQAEQRLRDLASQKNIQLDNLFSQYSFDVAELEDRADAAQLEQQSFLLAMNDKKYLDELQKVGQQRQLEDQLQFDREVQDIVFESNLNNLLSELQFKRGANTTRRQFNEQLAQIDIDMAVNIAQQTLRDEATRQMWQSAGTIGSIVATESLREDEK